MPINTRSANANKHPGNVDKPSAPRRSSTEVAAERKAKEDKQAAEHASKADKAERLASVAANASAEDAAYQTPIAPKAPTKNRAPPLVRSYAIADLAKHDARANASVDPPPPPPAIQPGRAVAVNTGAPPGEDIPMNPVSVAPVEKKKHTAARAGSAAQATGGGPANVRPKPKARTADDAELTTATTKKPRVQAQTKSGDASKYPPRTNSTTGVEPGVTYHRSHAPQVRPVAKRGPIIESEIQVSQDETMSEFDTRTLSDDNPQDKGSDTDLSNSSPLKNNARKIKRQAPKKGKQVAKASSQSNDRRNEGNGGKKRKHGRARPEEDSKVEIIEDPVKQRKKKSPVKRGLAPTIVPHQKPVSNKTKMVAEYVFFPFRMTLVDVLHVTPHP